MPEGVAPYPRWRGALGQGDRWATVAAEETRQAFYGTWSRVALVAGLAVGLFSVIEVLQLRQEGVTIHELGWFLAMLGQLRWFALAVAVAVGGPSILEDARRGALELYLTRSVSHRSYLVGKSAALFALTALTFVGPIVLYYIGTLVFYDQHPPDWHRHVAAGLAYGVMWAALVSGVALGVSCVARSSRGAALLLLGGFVGLEIVVSRLLAGLTSKPEWKIVSPFSATDQFGTWLFGIEAPHAFPPWWGLVYWAALTAVGWALVAWKRPRVRGEERAGA